MKTENANEENVNTFSENEKKRKQKFVLQQEKLLMNAVKDHNNIFSYTFTTFEINLQRRKTKLKTKTNRNRKTNAKQLINHKSA